MMHWFAHPWMLLFFGLLPGLMLMVWRGNLKKRQTLARVGAMAALRPLVLVRPGRRAVRGVLLFLGLVLLILGGAGPQWGEDYSRSVSPLRDLVVVLDMSRSMQAELPSRHERALQALRDLGERLEEGGGRRVSLVVFAAKAKVMFPLTRDLEHFLLVLEQLDKENVVADLGPGDDGGPSGTRIGNALALAVQVHDSQQPGPKDILLLSDGDDPARDDEWASGAEEARRKQIPVHTVGLGEPNLASTIPFRGAELRYQGKIVYTKLEEKPLEEIARRTGGLYLPARNNVLPLGEVFREAIEGRPLKHGAATDREILPVPRPRQVWFFAAALGLLFATLLMGDRLPSPLSPLRRGTGDERLSRAQGVPLTPTPLPKRGRGAESPAPGPPFVRGGEAARIVLVMLLGLLISAGPATNPEESLHLGNEAFRRGDYEAAVTLFSQAEERAQDPGLVAFNKAAALYRLGHYVAAGEHYGRSLEDAQAPPSRRAQAFLAQGNCFFLQADGKNPVLLEQAIQAYQACLEMQASPTVAADARFNLELAKHLWLHAKPNVPVKTPEPTGSQKNKKPNSKTDGNNTERPGKNHPGNGKTEANGKKTGEKNQDMKKSIAPGPLHMLPDTDKLVPMSAANTRAYLDQLAERIWQQRRERTEGQAPPALQVKDW